MKQKHHFLKNSLKALIVPIAVCGLLFATYGHSAASGDASFALSPSSGSYTVGATFTVSVSETSSSGDNVEGVQADLTYSSSELHFNSVSESGSPFTICGQSTGGGGSVEVGCASTATVSGTQPVAQINFTVESAGSATVSMVSGSAIENSSGTSVWNGSLPSASYTSSNPTTTTTPPPTNTTTPPSSGSGGGTTSGKTTTTTTTGSTAKTGTATTTPTSPTGTTAVTTTASATTPTTSSTTTNNAGNPSGPAVGSSLQLTIVNSQGQPVANAKVVIDTANVGYTNKQGVVTFTDIRSGTYNVIVTDPGKKAVKETYNLSGGQEKLASVKLTNATDYGPLIVTAEVILVLGVGGYLFTIVKRRRLQAEWTSHSGGPTPPAPIVGGPVGPSAAAPPPASPVSPIVTVQPTTHESFLQPSPTLPSADPLAPTVITPDKPSSSGQ